MSATLAVRERPILFSGRMVRAILAGRKTQTRRVIRPYGQPGDRLWVRETWGVTADKYHRIAYRADEGTASERHASQLEGERWRPSIHMPRSAARLTLEITAVRVQRVQEITGDDVIAEGVEFPSAAECTPDALVARWKPFRNLWDSINAPRGYGWDANPWVWVIEFRRIEA